MLGLNGLCRYLQDRLMKPQEPPGNLGIFTRQRVPAISLSNYIDHLQFQMNLTEEHWSLVLTYLSRLQALHLGFALCKENIHRVLLTSVVLAEKYLMDRHHNNRFLCTFAGVNLDELNKMEAIFLEAIDWDLSSHTDWSDVLRDDDSTCESFSSDLSDSVLDKLDPHINSEMSIFFK